MATQTDRKLRDLLWATHPCSGKYCDDGELQCGCFLPPIDFLRDKPEDIEAKIPLHNAQLLEQKRLDRPDGEKVAKFLYDEFNTTSKGEWEELERFSRTRQYWLTLAHQILTLQEEEDG